MISTAYCTARCEEALTKLESTMEQSKPQHNRPWFLLITDFAAATTLHGVRYLVEPTKFIFRRCAYRPILSVAN